MNQNNQPPQTPPSAQVPDQRLDQMMEQFRRMEIQNAQLRAQIDMMARQANPQNQQKPKEPAFKPEVQQAIDDAIEAKLQNERMSHRQQIGYLADQLDQAKFQTTYGGEKYAKFVPKVEALRQEYQARNQYITREDALRMVYFEEAGKKGLTPDPAPVQAPPQPQYDPYLRTFIDPTTGAPVQPQYAQEAPEEPKAPPPAQSFQAQPPPQQQPPQWGMTPPGTRVQPGQLSAHGQNFGLPGQGINPAASAAGGAPRGPQGPLDLSSSDAQLQAFEEKFGDIPL